MAVNSTNRGLVPASLHIIKERCWGAPSVSGSCSTVLATGRPPPTPRNYPRIRGGSREYPGPGVGGWEEQ